MLNDRALSDIQVAGAVSRACLAQERSDIDTFQHQMSVLYGDHNVCRLGHRNSWAHLDLRPTGAVDYVTVSGSNISFGRSGPQASGDWLSYVFLARVVKGTAKVSHYGRHSLLQSADSTLIDSFGTGSLELSDECVISLYPLERRLLATQQIHSGTAFAKGIRGDTRLGRLLGTVLGSLDEELSDYGVDEEEGVNVVVSSIVDQLLRTRGREDCSSQDRQIIGRLEGWVKSHIDDPDISPETLLIVAGQSRRQLYRVFRRVGITPAMWLTHLRLNKARECILSNATQSMTQVAFATGFSSSAHFSRAYKRYFGYSPKEERILSKS